MGKKEDEAAAALLAEGRDQLEKDRESFNGEVAAAGAAFDERLRQVEAAEAGKPSAPVVLSETARVMKAFGVGRKGGLQVVSMSGVIRYRDAAGIRQQMRSGDVADVPMHVIKKANAGRYRCFVEPIDPIPRAGDPC